MSNPAKTLKRRVRRATAGVRPTRASYMERLSEDFARAYSAWCQRRGLLEYDQQAYVATPVEGRE